MEKQNAITPDEFRAAGGVEDWRIVGEVATSWFPTGTFAGSARLVRAIGALDGLDDHQIEVDARSRGVTVRLITITADHYGLTAGLVDLARAISSAAREQGLRADPAGVQGLVINIGAVHRPAIVPFWRAVLDFEPRADNPGEELNDPRQLWPLAYFQQLDPDRPKDRRIHVDVFVPRDAAEARVAAAVAAGGRITWDNAPWG